MILYMLLVPVTVAATAAVSGATLRIFNNSGFVSPAAVVLKLSGLSVSPISVPTGSSMEVIATLTLPDTGIYIYTHTSHMRTYTCTLIRTVCVCVCVCVSTRISHTCALTHAHLYVRINTGAFNFSCSFSNTSYAFLWVDDHLVCQDGHIYTSVNSE